MAKLVWDTVGAREFHTGVSKCVLYPQSDNGTYQKGVAWSGITGITESPSGAEATALYADNIKYLNLYSAEEFGATVEAYMYPPEFGECNGEGKLAKGATIAQQNRKAFGLCYRTQLGNDIKGADYGYLLHIIYGCKASPSERAYSTINDSPEGMTLSYELTTTPVDVDGFKPTSVITIDSTKTDPGKLTSLEAILYGTDTEDSSGTNAGPRLPMPSEIAQVLGEAS